MTLTFPSRCFSPKDAIEKSAAGTPKNSVVSSFLANLGSFASAALAMTPDGVVVDVNATTTIGTGVAVFAVFGLKTRDLTGDAPSGVGSAKERRERDISRDILWHSCVLETVSQELKRQHPNGKLYPPSPVYTYISQTLRKLKTDGKKKNH